MALEFKDYYKTLGVPKTAEPEKIKKAFRRLAREYHPDVAKDKKTAEEKFKEINEAYEVLSDPTKRKKYDSFGADWNRPEGFSTPPGWQQAGGFPKGGNSNHEFHFDGTGFSDFFEQFFSSNAGEARGASFHSFSKEPFQEGTNANFSHRVHDIEGSLLVTLKEALHGVVRSISLQRVNQQTGRLETHEFKVRIPAGVQEGQLIRIAGKGGEGVGGGPAGDLYLKVTFARHPDFQLQGSDLYHTLELAPWEAVLGAAIPIPTLEGFISLKIAPGTRAGQKLRVRGKGLLNNKDGARGDLYVKISIQVPAIVNEEEKQLWEQLAGKSDFNPRKQ